MEVSETTKQVLIVEDDPDIRELYRSALEAAHIPVLTAQTGAAGLSLALAHHPAVILMDIGLPGTDGHSIVRKIRADAWGRTAKIIYLTNASDAENVVFAIEQRPEKYIVKANTTVKEVVNEVRLAMHQ